MRVAQMLTAWSSSWLLFSQEKAMGCFKTFLEEFPDAQKNQITLELDKKSYVVFCHGKAYMLHRPITLFRVEKDWLIQQVSILTGCNKKHLILGWVDNVDVDEGAIIATFENTVCPRNNEGSVTIVLHCYDIIWIFKPKNKSPRSKTLVRTRRPQ